MISSEGSLSCHASLTWDLGFFTFLLKGVVHFYMQQTLAPILTRIYVDYEQIGKELLIDVTTDSHAANMYLIKKTPMFSGYKCSIICIIICHWSNFLTMARRVKRSLSLDKFFCNICMVNFSC